MKKLMEFYEKRIIIEKDKQKQPIHTKQQFCVYGTYHWKETGNSKDVETTVSAYPVFSHLRVTQASEGKEVPYEPPEILRSDVSKIFHMFATRALAMAILGTTAGTFRMLFLDEGLREFVNRFRSDKDYVLSISGLPIFKYIASADLRERLELEMATDRFLYYSQYGMFDVLRTSNHYLVSNNELADNCYLESLENIGNGTEKLLWGKIRERYEDENVGTEKYNEEILNSEETALEFR